MADFSAEAALRFLAHEASRCHDRDAHEALCLTLPALVNSLGLEPMHYADALEFIVTLRRAVRERAQVMTGADFQEP